MRDPNSAAVLRREDARLHPLQSAAAQRVGALLLEDGGDEAPTMDASAGATTRAALATLASCGIFLLIARTDFHAAGATGFLATPTVGASGSREVPTEDPRMRLNSKFGAMAGAVALSVGGQAVAQNAVQWRVADGGNGHWYALRQTQAQSDWNWSAMKTLAESEGGSLCTVSSSAENAFISGIIDQSGLSDAIALGGRYEPGSGWRWVDGSAFTFTAWGGASCSAGPYPNNNTQLSWCLGISRCSYGNVATPLVWDDEPMIELGLPRTAWMVEWSADCNNDGLVDYGQILASELADANHNNIPDCCEQGNPCAQNAVQWRVADGGNGHWYEPVVWDSARSWIDSESEARRRGAMLACITSESELNFVSSLGLSQAPCNGAPGWLLGGYQDLLANDYSEPLGGWRWISGEPWNFAPWFPGRPDNYGKGGQNFLNLPSAEYGAYFDDVEPGNNSSTSCGAILEWSADCNNDGLVDYGQILAGELADANLNNIPDCCEGGASCNPCPGDVDNSGAVNGVDLAAILNSWGTSGGKYPGADVNHDGVVNGSDLAIVLNSWGPCP